MLGIAVLTFRRIIVPIGPFELGNSNHKKVHTLFDQVLDDQKIFIVAKIDVL